MEKLYNLFRKGSTWLASFGVDRYLHLIAGILISFLATLILVAVSGEGLLFGAVFGFLSAVVVGLGKEILDQTYIGKSDIVDWIFTIIGGAFGTIFYLI